MSDEQPKDRDTTEGGEWIDSEYSYEQFDAVLAEMEWACELP